MKYFTKLAEKPKDNDSAAIGAVVGGSAGMIAAAKPMVDKTYANVIDKIKPDQKILGKLLAKTKGTNPIKAKALRRYKGKKGAALIAGGIAIGAGIGLVSQKKKKREEFK